MEQFHCSECGCVIILEKPFFYSDLCSEPKEPVKSSSVIRRMIAQDFRKSGQRSENDRRNIADELLGSALNIDSTGPGGNRSGKAVIKVVNSMELTFVDNFFSSAMLAAF